MSLLFQLREWEHHLAAPAPSTTLDDDDDDDLPPPTPSGAHFARSDDAMDVDEVVPAFGATRTASERRAAHRRTFSTELR
jgi:hypothetical protein